MKYVIKRFAVFFLTLFLSISFCWILFRLIPEDPIARYIRNFHETVHVIPSAESYAYLAFWEEQLGYNLPLWEQFVRFWNGLILYRDFGPSLFYFPAKVQNLIMSRLSWTIGLMTISVLISWFLGIIIGAFAGWKQGTKFDKIINAFAIGLSQIPFYVIAVLSVLILCYILGWFPIGGAYSPKVTLGFNIWFIFSVIQYATLPALTIILTTALSWVISQRSLLISILGEDYLLFSEAKGLKKGRIFLTYALRNTMLPQVTSLAISMSFIMSGSIIVETIFNYPGIGQLMSTAIANLDYNLIMGCLVITIFTVLTANLLIDLILPFIDPRIRYGSQ